MSNEVQNLIWIVIPTWNRCQDLLMCLESLREVTYPYVKILVVDNASEDDSVDAVHKHFSEVEIIQLSENMGAPVASNIGFEYALSHGADFVLRLDSDTVVSPDFIVPLIAKMVENSTIGIISPKILYFDQPDRIWYAGVDAHPFHFGSIHDLIYQQESPAANHSRVVDYTWGAAMLIRREVLELLNGFDPQFFIYFEEVDFCKRVQAAGFKVYYLSESKIWHKVGTSNPTKRTAYQWNRSKMILFRKHARNPLHRIALILYAYLYAIGSPIFKGDTTGNRGPLNAALQGLSNGLSTDISKT